MSMARNQRGICIANSGNYLLLKKIKESLAGRIHLLFILPLSWRELPQSNNQPGLLQIIKEELINTKALDSSITQTRQREERIIWGGLPVPCLDNDYTARKTWIRDYIKTYILPLVIEQFNVRETLAFEQAARLILLSNAQFLNANKIAQAIGISQPTIMNYIYYLEALMVIKRVPVFLQNPNKRLIKHPKVYVCDSALINELLGNHFSIPIAKERNQMGSLYETFIYNEIQKTLSNYDLIADTFTWRTQDGAEVDLIYQQRMVSSLLK